ncbi:MAG: DNA recombination protein RmuC [Syntrophales bacterium]|jgi:DNA recombination protein RmuC|nr:DNA recombination protein RmuC [Syntrophales bacterium]MCK9391211.1 DNA recombination protein RmuC [Syntrophales bacterium]
MTTTLLYLLIALNITVLALLVIILLRTSKATVTDLNGRLGNIEKNMERAERTFREDMARNREEMGRSLKDLNESLLNRVTENAAAQKGQLEIFSQQLTTLTSQNIQKLDKILETVVLHLRNLQEDHNRQLELIRATVDEKLQDTLEKRLGESFRLVSERLEMVQKGLGEMQTLAAGVGDLKKVLTNIKTRGTFGEIQLGSLLEQILSPEQYAVNVATKQDSMNRVEFAIKLPGQDENRSHVVWLPLDAKFPQEDYLRLLEAQEQGNPTSVEEAARQLERTVREMAKNIRDKYLDPPNTTDFGIMFLPAEGLYAEVLRRTGLVEILQRDFKVVVTGPTTLAALLNSLQMGFRTLAIEKRSSDVWSLLGAVKTEFTTFGGILEKTHKKLQEASNIIEKAATRSRSIERRLKNVQEMPAPDAETLIEDNEEPDDGERDERC